MRTIESSRRRIGAVAVVVLTIAAVFGAQSSPRAAVAATLPSGFSETPIATGLTNPTAMEFAPDGRIFVAEQGGTLRVVKNDALLATPFVTLPVDTNGERGLLGVTFDPSFASNGYLYVYYTAASPTVHNRLSRFTAAGDVAAAGSELVLLDLPTLGAQYHNGGAIHFGPDGKLYVAVGENTVGANAQSMTTLLGKMLRLNSDGGIPADNPFYNTAIGNNRLIWALGLRNPFTFAFQPGTGRMFINDVGQNTWEEINDGIAGSNYGWPNTEGVTSDPQYRSPLYVYDHNAGCAITGGAFYNPTSPQFPASYTGKYFFADYCSGWIRLFNPATGTATDFASAINSPVDLHVGANGSLYYLYRGSGAVNRVNYAGADGDADGVGDAVDNCPTTSNASQVNTDAAALNNGPMAPGDDITIKNSDTMGDACDPDMDNDGRSNASEATAGACGGVTTNSLKIDTDGDHLTDGWECANGSDPTNAVSKNIGAGTSDADGDHINDLWEQRGYNGSASSTDSDGDGCADLVEIASIDGNKSIGDPDRLSVARRALGIWGADVAQDYVLDIDKNGVVGDSDRLFVARAALLSNWLPKSCP